MPQIEYTTTQHVIYTLFGLLTLGVILFTLKGETDFLLKYRAHKFQFILSVVSIVVMLVLTLMLLGHWFIPHLVTITGVLFLVPLLLVLSLAILLLRGKAFREMAQQWRDEQKKLINEVEGILDEKKLDKIRQGKIERGEDAD